MLKKFLKSNYDLWKYASDGMKEFKCRQCGHCCKGVGIVSLTPEEYVKFRDSIPDSLIKRKLPNTDVYAVGIGNGCPYLVDNQCTIYEDRPHVCRLFPLKLDAKPYPFAIRFHINPICKYIEEDEMIDLDYDDYLHILRMNTFYYNPEDWIEFQDDIQQLEEYKPKMILNRHITWCSVCKRTFKDIKNHEHPIPERIEEILEFLGKIENKYMNNKTEFINLLYNYMRYGNYCNTKTNIN